VTINVVDHCNYMDKFSITTICKGADNLTMQSKTLLTRQKVGKFC